MTAQNYRIELEINVSGQIYRYGGFIPALLIERAKVNRSEIIGSFLRRLLNEYVVSALLEQRTDAEFADLSARRGRGVGIKPIVCGSHANT